MRPRPDSVTDLSAEPLTFSSFSPMAVYVDNTKAVMLLSTPIL